MHVSWLSICCCWKLDILYNIVCFLGIVLPDSDFFYIPRHVDWMSPLLWAINDNASKFCKILFLFSSLDFQNYSVCLHIFQVHPGLMFALAFTFLQAFSVLPHTYTHTYIYSLTRKSISFLVYTSPLPILQSRIICC